MLFQKMGGQANLFQKNVITLGYGECCHPISTIWHKSFSKKTGCQANLFQKNTIGHSFGECCHPILQFWWSRYYVVMHEEWRQKQQTTGCRDVSYVSYLVSKSGPLKTENLYKHPDCGVHEYRSQQGVGKPQIHLLCFPTLQTEQNCVL